MRPRLCINKDRQNSRVLNDYNGAVYILSSHLLEALKSEFNQVKDFSTEVLPKLVGKIFAFETSSALIDIGTADGYMNAVTHDAKK